MTEVTRSRSIFLGTDKIIASAFGLRRGQTLKQKTACRRIASAPLELSTLETMISDLYGKIENNRSDHPPSRQNWRLERQTELSPRNRSPEVLLERAIALLGERGDLADWYNQVPVASGLVDDRADKRAAIDLLRYRDGRAAFIELKWESDTPAFAAFEILRYGLAYLFSYVKLGTLGYQEGPLMAVGEVSLRVLAPGKFYDDHDLSWLGHGLDQGLRTFAAKMSKGQISMDFGFLAFPSDFKLPFSNGKQVLQFVNLPSGSEPLGSFNSAIRNLQPVWSDAGRQSL